MLNLQVFLGWDGLVWPGSSLAVFSYFRLNGVAFILSSAFLLFFFMMSFHRHTLCLQKEKVYSWQVVLLFCTHLNADVNSSNVITVIYLESYTHKKELNQLLFALPIRSQLSNTVSKKRHIRVWNFPSFKISLWRIRSHSLITQGTTRAKVTLASLRNPTQWMIYMVDYYTNIQKFNSESINRSSMGTTLV